MAKVELILPKMGESVAEATITTWLKNEGDLVDFEDAVLEIATDKVDSEVPSTVKGVLVKQLFKAGEIVKVGEAVAIIESDSPDESVHNLQEEKTIDTEEVFAEENAVNSVLPEVIVSAATGAKDTETNDKKRFYSPLVKNIAKEEQIPFETLEKIPGSGKNNRLTKNDILAYLKGKNSIPTAEDPAIANTNSTIEIIPVDAPAASISGSDEIIEMDRMRKLIAENMVKSKQISAHVTSMVEVDVTNMVLWRNKIKDEFLASEGYKMTFTPLFVEAVAKALRDFPMINISIDGDKIIKRKDINVGIAVALPSGNLIVPVVKNADQLNLIGLAKKTNELAVKARKNQLSFEDIQGGTFTLTNIGTFGNAIGTPIINQPEVAIMSTGIIQKKPAVIETPQGDTIGIRHMMFLSMSYDHRVVDGMLGGSYIRRVADYLESFDFNRPIMG